MRPGLGGGRGSGKRNWQSATGKISSKSPSSRFRHASPGKPPANRIFRRKFVAIRTIRPERHRPVIPARFDPDARSWARTPAPFPQPPPLISVTMTTLPPALSDWFAAKGWTLHPHQEDMLALAQWRPRHPPHRPHGRRQDPGRLPANPRRTRPQPAPRPPHPLRLPPQGPHRRHPPQPRHPHRRRGPEDPGRGPHRRHHLHPAPPPARRPAAYPADHARKASPSSSATKTPPASSPGCNASSSTKSTPSPNPNAATSSSCRSPACNPSTRPPPHRPLRHRRKPPALARFLAPKPPSSKPTPAPTPTSRCWKPRPPPRGPAAAAATPSPRS
jgi:hypothetical protein